MNISRASSRAESVPREDSGFGRSATSVTPYSVTFSLHIAAPLRELQ